MAFPHILINIGHSYFLVKFLILNPIYPYISSLFCCCGEEFSYLTKKDENTLKLFAY